MSTAPRLPEAPRAPFQAIVCEEKARLLRQFLRAIQEMLAVHSLSEITPEAVPAVDEIRDCFETAERALREALTP